jgi:hypothetical protein
LGECAASPEPVRACHETHAVDPSRLREVPREREGRGASRHLANDNLRVTDHTFSARYAAAMARCGGRCPIEAGVLGRLADHECSHGRLPFDRTPTCGCWPEEGAVLIALPQPTVGASDQRAA